MLVLSTSLVQIDHNFLNSTPTICIFSETIKKCEYTIIICLEGFVLRQIMEEILFYTEYTINNNNQIDFEIKALWGLFLNNDNGQLSTLIFPSLMTDVKYS